MLSERSQKNYAHAEGLLYRQNLQTVAFNCALGTTAALPEKICRQPWLAFKRKLIYIRLVATCFRPQRLMHWICTICKDTTINSVSGHSDNEGMILCNVTVKVINIQCTACSPVNLQVTLIV